jgi:DNA-binding transcriptional ArsR family regulator
MTRLLPTGTDATVDRSDDPEVLCIDDEATRDVFTTLSSETAYAVFRMLNEEPATPPSVAERLDLSIQNAHYHLGNLEDAGLIEVADTCYSEKGREMDVFVVAEDPTLVFLGTSDDRPSLKRAVKSLVSFVGLPVFVFALGEAVSRLFGGE